VEPDDARPQHAGENLAPPRHDLKHVRGRKRDVQEEPDRGLRQPIAHEAGHEQQVVVVYPDHVAVPVLADHRGGEALVDRAVRVPVGERERNAIDLIVEQRPEDAVADAVVIRLGLAARDLHRLDSPIVQLAGHPRPKGTR
jgi:hypothetical protein